MLSPETPFPQVGSYGLLVDEDLPYPQPTELVRVLRRDASTAMVAFPLRDGASGNKVVPFDRLIDGTPLDSVELREFHDLDRALLGRSLRTKRQHDQAARRDALKLRAIWSRYLERKLAHARTVQQQRRKAA